MIGNMYSMGVTSYRKQYEWADWPEDCEESIASDTVYCAMFENPNAGGEEVGLGMGLTQTARTLSEYGTVGGASGFPPCRTISDGESQYFATTNDLINAALDTGGSPWTVIVKGTDCSRTDGVGPFSFIGTNAELALHHYSSGSCARVTYNPGDGQVTLNLGGQWLSSGGYYFAVWYTGSDLRACFLDVSSGKPTAYADIPAANKGSVTDAWDVGTFTGGTLLIGRRASVYWQSNLYFFIVASRQLIF